MTMKFNGVLKVNEGRVRAQFYHA